MPHADPRVKILVGPSGSGKTLVARKLFNDHVGPKCWIHATSLLCSSIHESVRNLRKLVSVVPSPDPLRQLAVICDDFDVLLVNKPENHQQNDMEDALVSEMLRIAENMDLLGVRFLVLCCTSLLLGRMELVFSPALYTYEQLPNPDSLMLVPQRRMSHKVMPDGNASAEGHFPSESICVDREEILRTFAVADISGAVIYGPSGSGKTFLCKHIARMMKRPVVYATAADVVSRIVGGTEKNISDLFSRARSRAPCVLVFDSIDVFALKRTGGSGASASDQVLTSLLTELDGMGVSSAASGVTVLATSSDISALDEAVLRPGRLGFHIKLALPSVESMAQYLIRRALASSLHFSLDDARICIRKHMLFTFADVENAYQETVFRIIRSELEVSQDLFLRTFGP
eukprot:ANDGO_02640.mRNA.1 Cell division control protein 48